MSSPLTATPEPERSPLFPLMNQAILVVAMAIVAMLAITAIRFLALGVTRYQVEVYEGYVREALAQEDYARATEIATGAIRSAVNRSEHLGRAHLLKGIAELRAGDSTAALADLAFSGAFFQERYYFATDHDRAELTEAGTDLAKALLNAGDFSGARRAFGLAAAGSGRPVDYLKRLHESLNEDARKLLWGDRAPSLVVREYGDVSSDTLKVVVEEQGRKLLVNSVATEGESNSIAAEWSPAAAAGRSVYTSPAWMPLTTEPFTLRLIARGEGGPMPAAYFGYWFDSARESSFAISAQWTPLDNGWQQCTVSGDFLAQLEAQGKQRGFSIHDGILNQAGFELSQDSATKLWLDRIEVVLAE